MSYSAYDTTTTYGGGGGFVANSQSQTSPSGNKEYNDSVRPVTIKQMLDAQPTSNQDAFMIDGKEVHTVNFVGKVRNVTVQPTKVLYRLDDGTGTFEVKQWVHGESAQEQKSPVNEGDYARVMGRFKLFNNQRHLYEPVVRAITDYNEISYHLLEATYVHAYFTKGPLGEEGAKSGGAGGYDTNMTDAGQNSELQGLSSVARKVYEVLQTTEQNNEGLHLQEIASRLHLNSADVAAAGEELLNAGKIYTTVDDETWNLLMA